MTERLTDEEIDLVIRLEGRVVDERKPLAMATELRTLRAAALTGEEREALEWLRGDLSLEIRYTSDAPQWTAKATRAVAALGKLTGAR